MNSESNVNEADPTVTEQVANRPLTAPGVAQAAQDARAANADPHAAPRQSPADQRGARLGTVREGEKHEPQDDALDDLDDIPRKATRKRSKPGERRLQILQTLAEMLETPKGERITTAALAGRL